MRKIILILFYYLLSIAAHAEDRIVTIAIRDFPPFEFLEHGKIIGINQETISEVLSRAGYEAKFIPLPWKRALASVESGDLDAVASIRKSPDRAESFIFSDPIMYTQDYFFKNKNLNITPKDLDSLKSYNIGIVDKYFYGPNFNKENFPKLFPLTSSSPELDNLEKVESGRIDLALCSVNICNYWVRKYPKLFTNIDYLKSPSADSTHPLYIAFSKKDLARSNEIIKKFNAELAKYIAEGKIKKM